MIKCEQYDYIEIVCMHRYPIKLILKSGIEIEGVGVDTKRNDAREECIEMHIDGTVQLIVLDTILTLAVTVANPHFKLVTFD
ncbi:MAG: Rho-binding antiterminator [Moritella sp.]|uniref:Rho-binding antiterminator n=1 Tax=Moritella sp. TaxID=78556 RepID=UPI0029A0AC67|nr:Rho-binding antiterminator [Moritella sp.]MDX2322627.1 Rho-binding antiterminator [Moritella sp.]